MSNVTRHEWPTKPVDQILAPATYAAIQHLASATASVIARDTLGFRGELTNMRRLSAPRGLSDDQVNRLKDVLLSPSSYWIGHPIYRRLPPRPDFLIECVSQKGVLLVAVDLTNPGWQITFAQDSYCAFMFAGHIIREIAKELYPEFASPRKTAMWAKGAFSNVSDSATDRP